MEPQNTVGAIGIIPSTVDTAVSIIGRNRETLASVTASETAFPAARSPGHAPPPVPAGCGPAGRSPRPQPPAEGGQFDRAFACLRTVPAMSPCYAADAAVHPLRSSHPRTSLPCCSSTSRLPAPRPRPPSPTPPRKRAWTPTTLSWTETRAHAATAPSSATAALRCPASARPAYSPSMTL